jgi:hypothetical protein
MWHIVCGLCLQARFEVLPDINTNNSLRGCTVFWDVTPCSLVSMCPVPVYQITHFHISEDSILCSYYDQQQAVMEHGNLYFDTQVPRLPN